MNRVLKRGSRIDPRRRWVYDPTSLLTGIIVIVLLSVLVAVLPLPGTATVMVESGPQATVGSAPIAQGAAGSGGGPTDAGTGTAGPGDSTAQVGPGASGSDLPTATRQDGVVPSSPGEASSTGAPSTTPGDTTSQPSGAETPAGGATYQGVTSDSVLWGFSAQENGCGGFNQSEVAAAYGINSNPRVAYEVLQEYWNTHPLTDFPLPPEIREHVNPENGYWGRRIESVFRDSGGLACQDVGRANAVRMAEEDGVFGLIMRGNEGPEVPMSLVMAQHGLIHIGRHLTTASFQRQRAPYFFDGLWGSGEIQNIGMGSWICRDWKGGVANDTGDPLVSGLPRVFGITRPEGVNFDEASAALRDELDACGVAYKEYKYPADLSTVAANIETVVSRMKSDGVTTVLTADPFLLVLFMSQSMDKQRYFPEWVRSGFSDGSHPSYYTTFMTPGQARNAWAAADAASIAAPSYYESEWYRAWKTVRPDEEPGGDFSTYYYQFKLLALGMAGAGPNLTPQTFAEGLERLCSPCPRADPLLPLEVLGPSHPTNREGFTLVKWNPDKPCPVCPPDGEGNQPNGYFDFLEDGKRYGRRITDPDPG